MKKQWSVDDFKKFVDDRVRKNQYVSPYAIVSMSYSIATVSKPESTTVRYCYWLRSIAEQEISNIKSRK